MTTTLVQRFSVSDIAQSWGVSVGLVFGLIRDGHLPAIDVSRTGKRPRYLVSADALAAFESQRSVVPAASRPSQRPIRRKSMDYPRILDANGRRVS